ncbi:hypothetical protein GRS96_12370 [Rathayibacter sp. VKM Ac-2803]|uniref:hypothetical protein n=1 Tax=Rathayibacter sp. VKM Ac-2803 TaxID=2609256 RepID=UPI00135C8E8F|nr:hypothetical protein [Rathayibacter sp. VKM Ac-2803]MWV50064.1 hypothetical protein [Rathayibacter sp. VKM Ac-2803]
MIAEHYTASVALVEEDPDLVGRIHPSALVTSDGKLRRDQYVIAYPTPPEELNDERNTSVQRVDSKATFHQEFRAVSVSALGCAELVDRLLVRLIKATPVVEGRRCSPMQLVSVSRVLPDLEVVPPLYYCDITLMFISQRSTA